MADAACSLLARDRGKSARLGRAGAPRNRRFGCSRTDEQYAASASLSDRVYVCRGVVRTHLLGGSARTGWAWSRSVRSCASFRFLRSELYQDFFRPRKPAGNCFRGSSGVHPVLARRTAAAHSIVGPLCGIDLRSLIKRRCACAPTSRPCRRTCGVDYVQFCTNSEAHAHCRKSSEWIQVWQQRNQRTPRFSTVADQKGKGLRRLGGVEHILRIHHGYPGVIRAALKARVREDLTALSEESGSWERHAEEHPLLWFSPKLARGHRDGHKRPRRGQNRRIRTSARATLSDPRDARVCSRGQFGLSDPDARPDVHWFLPKLQQMAQGSGCARDSKEATQEIGPCSGCPSQALDQTSLR